MKQYNTIVLLEILNGVSIVSSTKTRVVINASSEWKESTKQYLQISKNELEVESIEETLFGYTLTLKIKEFINYSTNKEK